MHGQLCDLQKQWLSKKASRTRASLGFSLPGITIVMKTNFYTVGNQRIKPKNQKREKEKERNAIGWHRLNILDHSIKYQCPESKKGTHKH